MSPQHKRAQKTRFAVDLHVLLYLPSVFGKRCVKYDIAAVGKRCFRRFGNKFDVNGEACDVQRLERRTENETLAPVEIQIRFFLDDLRPEHCSRIIDDAHRGNLLVRPVLIGKHHLADDLRFPFVGIGIEHQDRIFALTGTRLCCRQRKIGTRTQTAAEKQTVIEQLQSVFFTRADRGAGQNIVEFRIEQVLGDLVKLRFGIGDESAQCRSRAELFRGVKRVFQRRMLLLDLHHGGVAAGHDRTERFVVNDLRIDLCKELLGRGVDDLHGFAKLFFQRIDVGQVLSRRTAAVIADTPEHTDRVLFLRCRAVGNHFRRMTERRIVAVIRCKDLDA